MWLLNVCSQFCLFTLLFFAVRLFDPKPLSVHNERAAHDVLCKSTFNSHRKQPSISTILRTRPVKIVFFFAFPFIQCFLRNNFRLRFCAVFLYLSLVHYQNVATTTMIILVPFWELPYTHGEFRIRPETWRDDEWPKTRANATQPARERKEDRHKSDLFSFTENIFLKNAFVVTTKIATAQDIFMNEFRFLLQNDFPFTESREKTKTWLEMEWVSIVKIPLCLHSRLRLHNAPRTSLRKLLYNFFLHFAVQFKKDMFVKKVTIKQFCCGSYFPIGWSLLLHGADRYRCNLPVQTHSLIPHRGRHSKFDTREARGKSVWNLFGFRLDVWRMGSHAKGSKFFLWILKSFLQQTQIKLNIHLFGYKKK